MKNCSVSNEIRNNLVIVNSTSGLSMSVTENSGGGYVDYIPVTLTEGLYTIDSFCTMVGDAITQFSNTGINMWNYTATYNASTGKITLATTGGHLFRINYTAGCA